MTYYYPLPTLEAENELLGRLHQNDESALIEIHQIYFPAVRQFLLARLNHREEAEDLANEVFFKLVQACRQQNWPRQSLRGWLFRVAKNALYDSYQEARAIPLSDYEELLIADDTSLSTMFARMMSQQRMKQHLSKMSEEHQAVLHLRFEQGMTLEDTADQLGRSVAAIKSLQFRALAKLRSIVEDDRTSNLPRLYRPATE
jgi:RNA polymerase sigma-70 factor (ECF subfamily)